MIDRLKILAKIDDIENMHCSICTVDVRKSNEYCYTKCEQGLEIRTLGDQLLSSDAKRIEQTLAKGKEMTTKEIRFLLSKEVTRKEIARAVGIRTQSQVKPFFDNIQNVYDNKYGRDNKFMNRKKHRYPAKVEVKQIIESNLDLENKDLIKKIAAELDVSHSAVYRYMRVYKENA